MKKKANRQSAIKPQSATTHTMNGMPYRILVEEDSSFGKEIHSAEITPSATSS
jgi:hypothetical protein